MVVRSKPATSSSSKVSKGKDSSSPNKRKWLNASAVSPQKLRRVLGKSASGQLNDDGKSTGSGNGSLQDLNPSDVSEADLLRKVSQANTPEDLFGHISQAEMIEKIFLWFGCGTIDLDWFFDDGTGNEHPSIVASPHNRELQEPLFMSC